MLSAAFPKTTSYWLPRSILSRRLHQIDDTLLELKLFSMTKHRKNFQKPTFPATTAKDSILGKENSCMPTTTNMGKPPVTTHSLCLPNGMGNKKTLRLSFAACSPQRPVMDPQTVSRIKRDCLRAPAIILAPIYVEADALATVCLIPE